jgi:hypothetical protein
MTELDQTLMPRRPDISKMAIHVRRSATALAVALLACNVGGCGFVNEKLSAGMGDFIPAWAGGLPSDAPPRPGTAKYDEFIRERERKRLEPAVAKDDKVENAASPSSSIIQ